MSTCQLSAVQSLPKLWSNFCSGKILQPLLTVELMAFKRFRALVHCDWEPIFYPISLDSKEFTYQIQLGVRFFLIIYEDFITERFIENHARIFHRAGFDEIKFYRYFDTKTRNVDIDGMLEDLKNAPDRSLILLHACAHNPTGCDPTREQWISIANVVEVILRRVYGWQMKQSPRTEHFQKKEHLVFFDSAYQGFASGDVDEDAFAVRYFVARNIELLCAQSFSKIFGLYGERVGNLAVVHRDTSTMKSVMDQLTAIAYDMYLSPPEHGALVVQTVLSDENLYAEWLDNVKLMANRIKSIRKSLYAELVRLNTPGSWNHIIDQIGMFSYTGLNGI